uniref:Ig-like domain-containing protein n=1 Tax=Hucho hucho TaxID=62062 RepID=A0A4W5PF12_9TELE
MKRCSLIHNQTEQNRSTHRMSRTFLPALLLYGLSLVSVLVSQSQTMVVHTGDTIILQCPNVTTAVGHTSWFKQYGFNSTSDLHNGFQRNHSEMFSNNTTIFLQITKLEIADYDLYFCGLYPHSQMCFVKATVPKIPGVIMKQSFLSSPATEIGRMPVSLPCLGVLIHHLSVIKNFTIIKGILKYSFFLFYPSVPFFVRHGKTSLVTVVQSVFEIHCSTEGPYR